MNYFSSPLGPETIPQFLKARSAEGLRRAMRINATRFKAFITYTSIQWVESEKSWYAWFYMPEKVALEEAMRERAAE